jgi:hypothetical protein
MKINQIISVQHTGPFAYIVQEYLVKFTLVHNMP